MSVSFQQNGNSHSISANTTSGTTLTTVAITGANQAGAFMIDNVGPNAAVVNIGYANTVTANTTTGKGFAVPVNGTKYLNLTQGFNLSPSANVYMTAQAIAGTATVIITPVQIFK